MCQRVLNILGSWTCSSNKFLLWAHPACKVTGMLAVLWCSTGLKFVSVVSEDSYIYHNFCLCRKSEGFPWCELLWVFMYQTECTCEGISKHGTVQIKRQKDFDILENRETRKFSIHKKFCQFKFPNIIQIIVWDYPFLIFKVQFTPLALLKMWVKFFRTEESR